MCLSLNKNGRVCRKKAVDNEGYCELHSPSIILKKRIIEEIKSQFPFEKEVVQKDLHLNLLNIYLANYKTHFKHLSYTLEDFSSRILDQLDYVQSTFLLNKVKEDLGHLLTRVQKNDYNYKKKSNKILDLFHIGSKILNYQSSFFQSKDKKKKFIPNVSFDVKQSLVKAEWDFWNEKYETFLDKLSDYCVENKPKFEPIHHNNGFCVFFANCGDDDGDDE